MMDQNEGKYKIGYVPGVYDMFHLGHLNLLKRSKERCEYLIVGVLTDELVMYFKGKKPIIPFQERLAIVEAIKYVDSVVPVDFDNTDKVAAWHMYHYDCHFSGNDHQSDWGWIEEQLAVVGAKMEYFPYTEGTSSSLIKKKLMEESLFQYVVEEITNKEIIIFGAGLTFDRYMVAYGLQYRPVFVVDNDKSKWGTEKNGIPILNPDEIRKKSKDKRWIIVCSVHYNDICMQLEMMGVHEYRVFSM